MPPTIQTTGREDKRSRGGSEKRSELVCRVKYSNTLPDIPFDPKFITYPFDSNRFVQYNPTSLERAYKHEILTEHDIGVSIDLINPDTYKADLNAYLDPEDERLLEEDVAPVGDTKRSKHHNKNVSWLRKTEYISTEYNRFTHIANKAEAKIGFNIKKYFKEENLYRDRESQINAIEQTFEDAKVPIEKHYSKPNVVPLEVLPILPDFELWKYPCAQVIFDTDPTPPGTNVQERMSQAMIRGMVDDAGDQFVAYFLPSEETLGKRKRDEENYMEYQEDEEYEYELAREYNWNVKNKQSRGYEESFFFCLREEGMHYNELETKVRLSKRRKTGGTGAPSSKTRLIVKHRRMNEQEVAQQEGRLTMLEPMPEEEEEEEQMDVDYLSAKPDENRLSGDEEQRGSDSEGERSDREGSDAEQSDRGRSDREGSASPGSRASRSRSRSVSRSRSRSVSRSRSRSASRSRSRSASGSRSRSVSRSRSRSVSRSRSRSVSRSRSRSVSRSRSRSVSRSRSRSVSRSRSRSASPSGSGSDAGSGFGSASEDEGAREKARKEEEEIFGSDSDDDL